MALSINNPPKNTSDKKNSLVGKPILIIASAGILFPPFIVAPKNYKINYKVNYIIAGGLGVVGGYTVLNSVFNFDWDYLESDKYAVLKGNIEGAIVGGSISIGAVALLDKELSDYSKIVVSGGIGAMLGYACTHSEFFGKYPDWADYVGAVIGAGVGVGVFYGINKIKK